MAEGYQERMDIQMHLLAWHAANIMNVHLKKKVTVKKLLGKQKTQTPTEINSNIDKALQMLKERRESRGTNNSQPSDKNRTPSI